MKMSNDKITLSILIPAYKEEENLKVLLPRLKEITASLPFSSETIIIDQIKSQDGTKEICMENDVKYLNRQGDNLYSSAVKTGIRYAKGDLILFMDADGSHSPEFITNLVREIDHFDVVIASRYVEGGDTENNRFLIILSWFVNFLYSKMLNIKCKDVSNSFKLYRASLLKSLTLNAKNFDIIEEIMYKICKFHRDVKIKEIPFCFQKRLFGTSKRNLWAFAISYLLTLFRLRFGK